MTATRQPSRLASSLAWLGSAGVLARRGSRVGHLPFPSPAAPPAQAPAAGSKPAAAEPTACPQSCCGGCNLRALQSCCVLGPEAGDPCRCLVAFDSHKTVGFRSAATRHREQVEKRFRDPGVQELRGDQGLAFHGLLRRGDDRLELKKYPMPTILRRLSPVGLLAATLCAAAGQGYLPVVGPPAIRFEKPAPTPIEPPLVLPPPTIIEPRPIAPMAEVPPTPPQSGPLAPSERRGLVADRNLSKEQCCS